MPTNLYGLYVFDPEMASELVATYRTVTDALDLVKSIFGDNLVWTSKTAYRSLLTVKTSPLFVLQGTFYSAYQEEDEMLKFAHWLNIGQVMTPATKW